jgi:hypothetical protein
MSSRVLSESIDSAILHPVRRDFPAMRNDHPRICAKWQHYGMILADNRSAIYISGAPDSRWNNNDLGALKSIAASNFDVVQMDTIYTSANVPTGPSPGISNFSASPASLTTGQSATLGPVRGSSVIVTPIATTTYTLYSTNQYGRTTAKVTVTVQ